MRELGAEIVAVEEGKVTLAVPYRDALSQQHGYFHGAVVGALCDSAAGYAAMTVVAPDREVLTTEYKISFLAPARGAHLVCRGRVERAGNRLVATSARAEVDGALCALMLQTIASIPAPVPDQRGGRGEGVK